MTDIGVARDRWEMADLLAAAAAAEGVWSPDLVPCGKGDRDMAPAVNALEEAIIEPAMVHDGNPLLTGQMGNL